MDSLFSPLLFYKKGQQNMSLWFFMESVLEKLANYIKFYHEFVLNVNKGS